MSLANSPARISTGVPGLDPLLGGGLLPGTLTVAVGATGVGKSQLGVQFAAAGAKQEGARGVVLDMSVRGDSQNHADYAARIADWPMRSAANDEAPRPDQILSDDWRPGDYLHVFDYRGRSVRPGDMEFDAWRAWQAELVRKMTVTIGFFYANFCRGARRVVIDGVDPTQRFDDSIQFELFEYVYEQILKKEATWLARDFFREHFRAYAARIAEREYDRGQIASLLLYTCHETMLEPLIERPLTDGDWLANANTIIYLGKIRRDGRLGRALYVPKHRGSAVSDDIVPFEVTEQGLRLGS